MNLTPQAQAVMLLTVSFGQAAKPGAQPLSIHEWAQFAVWLKDHNLDPADLLKGNMKIPLSACPCRSITLPRLENLLNRGGALGFALEKWQRANLWALTRSDPEYPQRLKRRLGENAPPVLFGCGNKALLESGGIAVVGSRNAGQDDTAFAENLGDAAAKQGYSIVSGGARGVDERAVSGALDNEGTAIGVLADGLLRTSTSAKYRKYLRSGDVVLTTPFNPEAGFNVGNAMSRNRYIYCLSDAAVVVSSTPDKGGTWNGATENLKAAWVPLWVKRTESKESGNPHLVRQGAHWIPDDLASLGCLLSSPSAGIAQEEVPGLSLYPRPVTPQPDTQVSEAPFRESEPDETTPQVIDAGDPAGNILWDQTDQDFYPLFLKRMDDMTARHPMKAEDIARRLDLLKSQVSVWLKQGVSDGRIEKLTGPIRYQSARGEQRQSVLFDDDG